MRILRPPPVRCRPRSSLRRRPRSLSRRRRRCCRARRLRSWSRGSGRRKRTAEAGTCSWPTGPTRAPSRFRWVSGPSCPHCITYTASVSACTSWTYAGSNNLQYQYVWRVHIMNVLCMDTLSAPKQVPTTSLYANRPCRRTRRRACGRSSPSPSTPSRPRAAPPPRAAAAREMSASSRRPAARGSRGLTSAPWRSAQALHKWPYESSILSALISKHTCAGQDDDKLDGGGRGSAAGESGEAGVGGVGGDLQGARRLHRAGRRRQHGAGDVCRRIPARAGDYTRGPSAAVITSITYYIHIKYSLV